MSSPKSSVKYFYAALAVLVGGGVATLVLPSSLQLPLGFAVLLAAGALGYLAYRDILSVKTSSDTPSKPQDPTPHPDGPPPAASPASAPASHPTSSAQPQTQVATSDDSRHKYSQAKNLDFHHQDPFDLAGAVKDLDILKWNGGNTNDRGATFHSVTNVASEPTTPGLRIFDYNYGPTGGDPTHRHVVVALTIPMNLPHISILQQGPLTKKVKSMAQMSGKKEIYFQDQKFKGQFAVYGEKVFAYELFAPQMMDFLVKTGENNQKNLFVLETLPGLLAMYFQMPGQPLPVSQSPLATSHLDYLSAVIKAAYDRFPPILEEKYGA